MRCRLCETRAAAVTCVLVIALVPEASAGPLRVGLGLDLVGRFHNSAFNVVNSSGSDLGVTAALEIVAAESERAGTQLAVGVEVLLSRSAASGIDWAGAESHSYLGLYGAWRWRPLEEHPAYLVLRAGWTVHAIPEARVSFSDAFGTYTWGAGVGVGDALRGGWSVEAVYVTVAEGRAESRVSPNETVLDGYDRVALMIWHRF